MRTRTDTETSHGTAHGSHAHDLDVSARHAPGAGDSQRSGLALLVVVGMLVIGFGTNVKPAVSGLLAGKVYEAKVVRLHSGPCAGTTAAERITCDFADVRLTQGPDKGSRQTLAFPLDAPTNPDLSRGDRVVLIISTAARIPASATRTPTGSADPF